MPLFCCSFSAVCETCAPVPAPAAVCAACPEEAQPVKQSIKPIKQTISILLIPDTSPAFNSLTCSAHPAGLLCPARMHPFNALTCSAHPAGLLRPARMHLFNALTCSAHPAGLLRPARMHLFNALTCSAHPAGLLYSASFFPSSNAFRHSSGNTVSWRTFFASGSNRVQGQSVLL